MALQKPKSTKELRYFSRKTLENGGRAMVWVFNPKCPECGEKGLQMPFNEETGKYKSRGKNFVCRNCGHEVPKKVIKEELPTANIEYTCPHCKYQGEKQAPLKRNSKKEFRFKCDSCNETIIVGKKGKK